MSIILPSQLSLDYHVNYEAKAKGCSQVLVTLVSEPYNFKLLHVQNLSMKIVFAGIVSPFPVQPRLLHFDIRRNLFTTLV